MAEVTGMTPEKIAQEITNVKSYVDGGLSEKADKTYVDNATDDIGVGSTNANKFVKLDSEGKLFIATASITTGGDPTNKAYVDNGLKDKADKTQVDNATHNVGGTNADNANKLVKLNSEGKLFISTASITNQGDPVNKAYVDSVSPLKSFSGSGSPEGKVSASVGTIYTDTAATNGAIRWIKTSGTDNIGWSVEYGDTGWRNAVSLLRNGWTADTFIFRRVRDVVEVRGTGLDGSSATDYTFFVPPQGFTPGAGSLRISASTSNSSVSAERVNIAVSGAFSQIWRTNMDAVSVALSTSYLNDEPWPTTLPGTPA